MGFFELLCVGDCMYDFVIVNINFFEVNKINDYVYLYFL